MDMMAANGGNFTTHKLLVHANCPVFDNWVQLYLVVVNAGPTYKGCITP